MVEIVNYTNEARETKFIATIESAYSAARELRPNLPQDIKIHFTDKGVVPGMFTGGYAHAPDTINIAVDLDEKNTPKVERELKATIFHEAFHISMGYIGQTGPFNLLECTIHEGAATIFAIEHAESSAGKFYGDYASVSTEHLEHWLSFAADPSNQVLGRPAYKRFAFYDSADDTRWKLYRLGTWLVANYIAAQAMDIKDFNATDMDRIIQDLK